jgi:hypothetical protein
MLSLELALEPLGAYMVAGGDCDALVVWIGLGIGLITPAPLPTRLLKPKCPARVSAH